MFIDLTRNNGKKYLRLADSVRVTNKDGFKVPEKVVPYWSKSFYEREVAENRSFLEFLDKFLEQPKNFRITATMYAIRNI